MKDIRLSYDSKTDSLAVGVNFYGIAGNTDGSKDGSTNPLTTAGRRLEPAAHRRRQVDQHRLHPRHRGRHQRRSRRRRRRPRQQGRLAGREPRRLQRRHGQRRRSCTLLGDRPGLRDDPGQQPRDARLRPVGHAPRLRVHHQELQQDPGPQRPDQRVLRLGLRRDRHHDHHRQERHHGHSGQPQPQRARRQQLMPPSQSPRPPVTPSPPTPSSRRSPRPSWVGASSRAFAGFRVRRRLRTHQCRLNVVIRSRTGP